MKQINYLDTHTEKIDRCKKLIATHQFWCKNLIENIGYCEEIGYTMPIIHLQRGLIAHEKAINKLQTIHYKLLKNAETTNN